MASFGKSSRNSYQRVNYRENSDAPSGPSTSEIFPVNEHTSDENEIEFELIHPDEADDMYVNVNITYDDFDTIDWTRDRQQDRVRFRRMKKLKKGTYFERLMEAHDAWSGWLVVLLVGLSCGLFAGVIDIGTDWMFDLKEGVCSSQIWLNKESCCWADNSSFTHDDCLQWKKWSEVFDASSYAGSYASNYFMFILSGIVFALVCVTLVHTFAPYACGSGIPEVCNIYYTLEEIYCLSTCSWISH